VSGRFAKNLLLKFATVSLCLQNSNIACWISFLA